MLYPRKEYEAGKVGSMKLLFITNFFPPAHRGGYEQWCQEIALGLRDRGHQITVLTSRYKRESLDTRDPDWVHRELFLEMEFVSLMNSLDFFFSRKSKERKNIRTLNRFVEEHTPDFILLWGMWNLQRSLAARVEEIMPDRTVYYIADYWPTLPSQFEYYWDTPGRYWITGIPKRILGFVAKKIIQRNEKPKLRLPHAIFPTTYLCTELNRLGVPMENSLVIKGGVETEEFDSNDDRVEGDGKIKVLYAGRLTPEKGVHTAIQAVSQIVHENKINNIELTLVGEGLPGYERYLRSLASEGEITDHVVFRGTVSSETMPETYAQCHILIFPSIWPEPFGRVLVEGMASGLPVVCTATGGAAEIVENGVSGLVFNPGDAKDLTRKLISLIQSPEKRTEMGRTAQQIAKAKFDLKYMIDGIESYLEQVNS